MPAKKKDNVTDTQKLPVADTAPDTASLFDAAEIQHVPGSRAGAMAGITPEPAPTPENKPRTKLFTLENLALAEELLAVPPPADAPIELGKPNQNKFMRVCDNPAYSIVYPGLFYGEDRQKELYVMPPQLAKDLRAKETFKGLICQVRLTLCSFLDGQKFIWPTRVNEGRPSKYSMSVDVTLDSGKRQWLRLTWVMEGSYYDITPLAVDTPPPSWPERDFLELLETAVGESHMIFSEDHEVIEKLAGKRV